MKKYGTQKSIYTHVTVIGSAVPDVDCPGVDGLEVTVGLSDSSRGDTLDGRDWGERPGGNVVYKIEFEPRNAMHC